MVSGEQRLFAWSAAIWSVAMVVAATFGFEQLLAFAAPFVLLVLPLLAGRYPGEERLVRFVACRREPRARAESAPVPIRWLRGRRVLARGGRLIAVSLAVRPPPFLAVR